MHNLRDLKKSQGAFKKSDVLATISLLKSTNLMLEDKLVHRGGKVFVQGFHVSTDKGKPTEKDKRLAKFFQLHPDKQHAVGTIVKFPDGGPHHKKGIIADSDSTHYTIRGKRTESGVIPVHRVPKGAAGGVISLEDYREHVESTAHKSDKKIVGDKTHARNTLDPAEWSKRKEIMEKRTGVKESVLMQHKSLYPKGTYIQSLINESADPEEARSVYLEAAMKSFRHSLASNRETTAHHIAEFKDVMEGKLEVSIPHYSAWRDGARAVKRLLGRERKERDIFEDRDYSDLEHDAAGAKILEHNSTQPQHLEYTLAKNRERLNDEISRVKKMLSSTERVLLAARYGFGKYEPVREMKDPTPAAEVADIMNKQGIKTDAGGQWNRNHVMTALTKMLDKIKASAHRDALAWHFLERGGRKMWKSEQEQDETQKVIGALLKEVEGNKTRRFIGERG